MQKDDISVLKGLGEKTKKFCNDNGIYKVYDLVHTLPKKYNSYIPVSPSSQDRLSTITIKAQVESKIAMKKFKGSLSTIIFTIISDNVKIKCLIFGKDYLRFSLYPGVWACFFGSYNPEKQEMYVREVFIGEDTFHIDVIYGLKNIADSKFQKFVLKAYQEYSFRFREEIPQKYLDKYKLLGINEYIKLSHFPNTLSDLKEIERRKKYEFYFKRALEVEALRYFYDKNIKTPKVFNDEDIIKLKEKLSFSLTIDQEKALDDIFKDMRSNHNMNRLIQGDVGSGKTVVALISAYGAFKAGFQSVLMVPSEILANQHFKLFEAILGFFGVRVSILTSSTKSRDRSRILREVKNNSIDILIGTQAVLNEEVKFSNVGLIIIDEQHKFGVKQRAMLLQKSDNVDSMFLTATPIPRTLGISRFGDLDISSIATKPEGRKRIDTKVISNDNLEVLVDELKDCFDKNHQAYMIVPMINESENFDCMTIGEAKEYFNDKLDGYTVGVVHGEMTNTERSEVMTDFLNNKINLLISTTIIEVGIDVKNATMMVIFNSERFGLATLHQLRGRIGRSNLESKCRLLTSDLSNDRLKAIVNTYDCFELSEIDLKLRGPGDFIGEAQSGFFLDVEKDKIIYDIACKDAHDAYLEFINHENEYLIVKNTIKNLSIKKINLN